MPQVQVLVTVEFGDEFVKGKDWRGRTRQDDRTLEQIACDEVEGCFGFTASEGCATDGISFVSAVPYIGCDQKEEA